MRERDAQRILSNALRIRESSYFDLGL